MKTQFLLQLSAAIVALAYCQNPPECLQNQFQCSPTAGKVKGRCILNQWRCDGEKDCPNGDDEIGCGPIKPQLPTTTQSDFFPTEPKVGVISVCRHNEFQCQSGYPPSCFPVEYRCDKEQDCPDGSDEIGCFGNEFKPNRTVCKPTDYDKSRCSPGTIASTGCKYLMGESYSDGNETETQSECSCEFGFHGVYIDKISGIVVNSSLGKSASSLYEFVCIDEDECSVYGLDWCSHHCVNTFGSYKCTCSQGFYLTQDGHTCRAYGDSRWVLVFSNRTEIFISNGKTQSHAVKGLSNADELAMEYSKRLIYWSDSSKRKIQRGPILRPSTPAVAKDNIVVDDVIAPNGLTVDWLRRLLFWVDGGRRLIEVVDLNNLTLRRAIVWEDIIRPRDIVCHPLLGLLFWAEWGQGTHKARIERIGMDGSDAHIVAHKMVYRPCGMVIDFATDKLFWVDAEKATLESSDFYGRHRTYLVPENSRGVLAASRLLQPVACAVFEDFAYISDRAERAVYSTRRHPLPSHISDVNLQAFTPHNFGSIGSLLVFHNVTQPDFKIKSCSDNGLNCSQLCLPKNAEEYTCACATGFVLLADNETCSEPEPSVGYIYLHFQNRLSRISLQGPDFVDRTFFTLPGNDDSRITAFDVDLTTTTFYFARRYSADQMLSLQTAKLPKPGKSSNGTSRNVLTLGSDYSSTGHFEVAVDWVTGNIYLLLAANGRIEVVSPISNSNKHRAVLVWKFISKAAHSLCLHPRSGVMFWVDTAPSSKSNSNEDSFYIVQSGLDGSRLSRFLEIGPTSTLNSQRPTIVVVGDRLFWTTENLAINSIRLDGSDRKVHLESVKLVPTLLSSNEATNRMYFFDSGESSLFKTRLDRNFSTLKIRPTLTDLISMKIPESPSKTPNVNNPCSKQPCSHLCMLSPDVMGYRCACSIGYTLQEDGTSCGKIFENLLIVAHGHGDLLQIDLTTPYSATLPLPVNPSPENVVAVTTDPIDNIICWADNGKKIVACSGSNFDTVRNSKVVATELDSVESIAYDYMNKNLYMADTVKPQIAVVHVPSGQLRLLLMRFTITQPRSLTLALKSGHLFWTEWNAAGTTVGGARIGKVDMDGSNAITIVDSGLGWPHGITVDDEHLRIFWGDTHLNRIESSDFDGENRLVFMTAVNPFGLVVIGNSLLWTAPESRAIRSGPISKTKSNNIPGSQVKTVISDTRNLFGMATIQGDRRHSSLSTCDIQCVGLCLRRPGGHRCLCPTGFQPTPTAESCQPAAHQIVLIVAESAASLVFLGDLASQDNSQHLISAKFPAVVLPRPSEESLIDADLIWNRTTNQLYYAVKTTNSSIIYRTNLSSGFSRNRLLEISNTTVLSLTVDPAGENVYWFEVRWSTMLTYLRVASISRLVTKTLLTNGFEQPKDLTIHPTKGQLFWMNVMGPASIETALGDGSQRRVLLTRGAGSPASLSLDPTNDLLYWTDTLTASLHVCELNGRILHSVKQVSKQAAVLAASPTHIFWTINKGKTIQYVLKSAVTQGETESQRQRLTEMHQVVLGLGIYDQPSSNVNLPRFSELCSKNCDFICLLSGESQLLCVCPDNSETCTANRVINASAINAAIDMGAAKNPAINDSSAEGEASPTSHQSLIALIGVAILFGLILLAVIIVVFRYRMRRDAQRPRNRSDSILSILLCDPCRWGLAYSNRPSRGRSTSPHANLTATYQTGQDDDASQALMTITSEKIPTVANGNDDSDPKRNQRLRQSQTVVSLRFDASDGGDNITVKRVETVL